MIYIIGAGGFARTVLNIYIDLGMEDEVQGFLEEECQRKGEVLNGKPIDDVAILKSLSKHDVRLICAIGTPRRKRLIEYTEELGFQYDTVIHPNVVKSRWVTLGKGCILCPGVMMTSNITIGDHTIINIGSIIGHDANIGRYVSILAGAIISGNVSIGDECVVGAGAVIIERVSIGKGSVIGAGACVVRDIPEGVVALGVPARPVKRVDEVRRLL